MDFEDFASARYREWLGLATAMTGDRGLAEEIVQDVLVKLFAEWARVSQAESPEAYVRRMIVNEYISWRRKWARLVPRHRVTPTTVHPDHGSMIDERDALRRDLARLPRRQQAVLVLRFWADWSDTQIAEALGCSVGTVRGYASRALATLRINQNLALPTEGAPR